MPEVTATGKRGCGHTLFTTCESAWTFCTSAPVFLRHTNRLPQSPPTATYASSHRNATPFKNVFTFLCPTKRRTEGSKRSVGSASNRDQGSGFAPSAPAAGVALRPRETARSRGTDALLRSECGPRRRLASSSSSTRTSSESSSSSSSSSSEGTSYPNSGDGDRDGCSAVGASTVPPPPRAEKDEDAHLEVHAKCCAFSKSIAQPSSRQSAVPRFAPKPFAPSPSSRKLAVSASLLYSRSAA
mmetsp:Transcript_13635/g.57311  ORF Transcript_13635/g.57311 Transcript_13635/m.57311 type:complete len:242 (+) Transcript_13635:1388-2113(+)